MRNISNILGFIFFFGFIFQLTAQNQISQIENQLSILTQENKLLSSDLDFQITSSNTSSISNIEHIYFSQELHGYIINNTESSIHIFPNNTHIQSSIRFIKNIQSKSISNTKAVLSAIEAVKAISNQMNYSVKNPLEIKSVKKGKNQQTNISGGGIAKNDIVARLKYFPTEDQKLVLVWEVFLTEINLEHAWTFYVDATTGNIINKTNNIFYCVTESDFENKEPNFNDNLYDISNYTASKNELLDCTNCYEVFAYPMENPYYGERTIVSNPANDIASPYGWHDYDGTQGADSFLTSGNNIIATNTNNYSPNGGDLLNFTNYPYDEYYSNNERFSDSAITNIFYWANLYHDVMYMYGFDDVSGNFQVNNYNNGGLGNDNIDLDGQLDSYQCNAAIAPFPDGISPYMILGTCGNRDSAYDNVVVVHEYTHGLVHRLIGGANSGNCLENIDPIDEGYADWYGLMFTMNAEDQGEDARGFASYYVNAGTEGDGIRPYPYSTNLEINPFVYQSYPNYDERYNWVWASALWEVTWKLIETYGFDENIYNFTGDVNQDAGNIMALAIVTESLKLLNCYPFMIDARNAIFAADQNIYNGENECLLWEAFAKRGLGAGAMIFGVPSFDEMVTANLNLNFQNVCVNSNIREEVMGGFPLGGFYSGDGVTDNGDGISFTFNPEMAGIGNHTITYEIEGSSSCRIASTSEYTITVKEDLEAPVISCLENENIIIPLEESFFEIPDYTALIEVTDNCGIPEVSQVPVLGTELGVGDYTITVGAEDSSGNQSFCTFVLNIKKEIGDIDNLISISPNPTDELLTFSSVNSIPNLDISIFNINGKLVKTFSYSDFNFNTTVSIKDIASGMYFVKMKAEGNTIVKRIIKY